MQDLLIFHNSSLTTRKLSSCFNSTDLGFCVHWIQWTWKRYNLGISQCFDITLNLSFEHHSWNYFWTVDSWTLEQTDTKENSQSNCMKELTSTHLPRIFAVVLEITFTIGSEISLQNVGLNVGLLCSLLPIIAPKVHHQYVTVTVPWDLKCNWFLFPKALLIIKVNLFCYSNHRSI